MIVKIVKIYLGLSLVLWAVWGHFQGGSLCLASSCFLVSSVSDFRPDTRGMVVDTFFFQAHLFSCAVGREGYCKQITLACVRSVSATHAHGAHRSGSTLLRQEPSEASPRLHALPRSKLLSFGAQAALRGTDSVGTAFCALPRSE